MPRYYIEIRKQGAIGAFRIIRRDAASKEEALEKLHAEGWETRGAGTWQEWNERELGWSGPEPEGE